MCSYCAGITLLDNFCGKVYRETKAEVKRSIRDTSRGRRLGFLTQIELIVHSHQVTTTCRSKRFLTRTEFDVAARCLCTKCEAAMPR